MGLESQKTASLCLWNMHIFLKSLPLFEFSWLLSQRSGWPCWICPRYSHRCSKNGNLQMDFLTFALLEDNTENLKLHFSKPLWVRSRAKGSSPTWLAEPVDMAGILFPLGLQRTSDSWAWWEAISFLTYTARDPESQEPGEIPPNS